MKVAVKDANLLIDLIEADLLGLWFQLDIETHTTDLVLHELKRTHQWRAVSLLAQAGNLKVRQFDPPGLENLRKQSVRLRVSLADASAFVVALELQAILLSGDRRLRNEAQRAGLEVHGALWVFDQLIDASVLSPGDAATKLALARKAGAYLPANECEERLRRWRSAS